MPGERDALLPANGIRHSYDGNGQLNGIHLSPRSWAGRIRARLGETVDPKASDWALTLQCIISGSADTAAFTQSGTWAGFMTGNVTQLTIAATTLVLDRDSPTYSSALQRFKLSSSATLGFIFGCSLAAYIDTRFHGQHRGKLCTSALVRALVFAVLTPWLAVHGWQGKGEREILFIVATCMGSMAVSALRLSATPYSTTVVFTSSIAALFSDPLLPASLTPASQKRARSIIALIVGGATTQTLFIASQRWIGHTSNTLFAETAKNTASTTGAALALGWTSLLEIFCAIAWYRVKSLQES